MWPIGKKYASLRSHYFNKQNVVTFTNLQSQKTFESTTFKRERELYIDNIYLYKNKVKTN